MSWHYAFFLNIPVGIGLVGLLFFGLHKERLNPAAFWRADWLGIFGLSLALGALTVVLEEGLPARHVVRLGPDPRAERGDGARHGALMIGRSPAPPSR